MRRRGPLSPFGEGASQRVDSSVLASSWARRIPFVATGHKAFRDPEGYPANRRPWGTLNAINLSRGEIVWQVPLGAYPELEAKGHPPTTASLCLGERDRAELFEPFIDS